MKLAVSILIILGLFIHSSGANAFTVHEIPMNINYHRSFGQQPDGVFDLVGSILKGVGDGIKNVFDGIAKIPPNSGHSSSVIISSGKSSSIITGTNPPGSMFGLTLPFGSIFGSQKSTELELGPFVSAGLLDDQGNIVGGLTDGQGVITDLGIKLANHLEDSLTLSQVNIVINRKLCLQNSIIELSSYLASNRFFMDRVKLMSEPAVQMFFEAMDGKLEIQYLKKVLGELFTCPPKHSIDNCADRTGALILFGDVVDTLETSLAQPQQLLKILKRKLIGDEKLRTALGLLNQETVGKAQKEIFKTEKYQKMVTVVKDNGKSSLLISLLLDILNPLQVVMLMF